MPTRTVRRHCERKRQIRKSNNRGPRMAPKLRVYNLARELNLDNAEIIRELQHMGVPVTSHSNTVDDRQAMLLRKKFAPLPEPAKPAADVVEIKAAKPAKAEPVVE